MKPRVVFLCTSNSARSQMAECWLRHLAGDRYDVCSAGTQPACLNPGSVEAWPRSGIDISHHRSKHATEYATAAHRLCNHGVRSRQRELPLVGPGAVRLIH